MKSLPFELGITTFAETIVDPITKTKPSYDERIRQVVEEIVLAEQVGLDFFGVGEHHRHEFASSAPEMILAAAASLTKTIKLGSAVTVLSSDDPVRVYQRFATLNALSHGRAEIVAGRGSFIESFPLFGYDLSDYDELYDEKIRLLVQIRDQAIVHFKGHHRPPIDGLGIYPRTDLPLRIAVAVGGTPDSVVRAAELGLPLFLAIIGGNPERFKPFVDLYEHAWKTKQQKTNPFIAVHSHGFILDHEQDSVDRYYQSMATVMNQIGRERGWSAYTRVQFDQMRSPDGALYLGTAEAVAKKIVRHAKTLHMNRFTLHVPVGPMPHDQILKTIRLFGEKVKPLVLKEMSSTTH